MSEEFRELPEYPGYQIGDRGTILGRLGKSIACGDNGNGYKYVHVQVEGKRVNRYVHRLVAQAFLGEVPEGHEVAHSDGFRDNNVLSNLSYKTKEENEADKVIHGTLLERERHVNSKLTDDAVREIRRRYAAGETQDRLGTVFGVSQRAIQLVIKGETWDHVEGGPEVKARRRGPRPEVDLTLEEINEIRVWHRALSYDKQRHSTRRWNAERNIGGRIAKAYGIDAPTVSKIVNRKYRFANV